MSRYEPPLGFIGLCEGHFRNINYALEPYDLLNEYLFITMIRMTY